MGEQLPVRPQEHRPVRRRLCDEDDRRYECTICRKKLMHPDQTVVMYNEVHGDTPHMVRSMYRSNLVDTIVNRTPLPDVSQHLDRAQMISPAWEPYFYGWNACVYACEECLKRVPVGDRLWVSRDFKAVSRMTWFPEGKAKDSLRKKWQNNRRFQQEESLEGAYLRLDTANLHNVGHLSNWNPVLASNLCVCCGVAPTNSV